jgi:hypothetical protein
MWLWGGRGVGVLSCVVDHILQEFNTPKKIPVKTTFRDRCLYSSFVHGLDPMLQECEADPLTKNGEGAEQLAKCRAGLLDYQAAQCLFRNVYRTVNYI